MIGILLIVSAVSCYADDCSRLVEGYLQGLETGVSLAGVDESVRQTARSQLARIKSLRESKTDCEVIDSIPWLKASIDAVNNAAEH